MRDIATIIVCAAVFVILVMPLRTSLVDDTYIHLQFARNLSEAGELSFNRGDPTYGATSPLFVLLLCVVHGLGGEILVWCRVLSWFFALASMALVYRLVKLLGGGWLAAALAALVTASEAWMLRWAAVGMETSLAAFMVLVVLFSSFHLLRSPVRSVLFGLSLFLAVLARPEAMLLLPLSCIVFCFMRGERRLTRFLWLIVFVPLLAVWLYLIHRHTGSFFPLTAGAKQGKAIFSTAVFRRALVPARIMAATVALPCIAVAAGIILGVFRRRSILSYFHPEDSGHEHRGAGIALMLLWMISLPLIYIVFDFQVLSRYLVPVTPAVVVLGFLGLRRIGSDFIKVPALRRILMCFFAALVVLQSVFFYLIVVVPPTQAFSEGMQDVLVGMGEWLRDNTPPDAVVATPDIGAIGYVSQRRVLDLGGLVTPEINRMRRRIDFEQIVEEGFYLNFRADYMVDRSATSARFSGKVIREVLFTPVMQGTVSNLGIRKPDSVVYVLYRLTRSGGAVEEGEEWSAPIY